MSKPKPYEAKKTSILHLRITAETKQLLEEVGNNLGLEKTNVARMLLLNSLRKLKSDSIKFGWNNLEFTIKTQ